MPVIPSTLGYRVSNITKETPRSRPTRRAPTSKSLRVSSNNHQTSPSLRAKKPAHKMTTNDNLLLPPRPPDPTLFIHAGTSGVRHLFPIHLTDSDGNMNVFPRSISRLRSRTPTTKLCSNIEMIRNICLSIQTLEHFDISENDLDDLPFEICLLIHLQTLNCSYNQLTNISDLFEKLIQLKELDLSHNHLKYLPTVVYKFKNLIRLNCEHNFIKIIDKDLLNLKYLQTLIFDHNDIQTFDNTIDFSQMKKLEYIHMSYNQLKQFPYNLQKLLYLKNVNLSHNNLTTFPIELLLINNLDVLNLSHNLMINLPPLTDAYKRTTLIFSIDLSFNQLTKFYDYLLFISLKLDLSNNKIHTISNDIIRKINKDVITNRELKMSNNPLVQPMIPSDILNEDNINTTNILPVLRHCLDEQQSNEIIRQGFKICITGCKKSGKSSLAYCLEECMPCLAIDKAERLVNISQFPFCFETHNQRLSSIAKPVIHSSKTKQLHSEVDISKRKRLSNLSPSQSSIPLESIKSLPLTIFDFNGTSKYYEYMSSFIDTNALHLVCIHIVDFYQTTPVDIKEVFNETFDITSYPILRELFQILQLLFEKVTKTNGIVIIPIATHIDLYDKQSKEDITQALDKINKFFKYYLQFRINRIKTEIERMNSLSTISSSVSYRLKTYTSLLNTNIQIEPCQPISSLIYEGFHELNQKIQYCISTHKTIFPHIDRILPTLWIDTNRYIESLADQLSIPYLSWENFTNHIINKNGLSHLINDITMSLSDEGKILVLNEIGTTNRIVFLRPLWLGDLLFSLFHIDNPSELKYQSYIKEYHKYGRLHSDLVRLLWINLLHKKEYFYQLWFNLMRFLLIAYPKINKKQLNNFYTIEEKNNIKFDYAIVPYYLPLINSNEQEDKKQIFQKQLTNIVSIRYTSSMLPLGFFHQYSVSAILKLDIIYIEHWNNFILGEYEQDHVKFILETDHRTYINCYCGANITNQPFEHIWNVLMIILNHFEEMFKVLAPNNQFNRHVRCPYCNEYSFMGEWTTPKELQGLKLKICSSCYKNIDTNYLIQPNENKRRNEDLLRKIQDRKANNTNKKFNTTTQLLVTSV
ncbi:unnamed protein product [Adineta steineri]|uniref:Uncharacterized protein n=1 Tax=Adineta steineri TaxID=433720 RepID=A0A815TBF9_9BILA|nr:unnamed protein product [Adineta steineri]CAF1504183.1 unnamed protein product [Adineta steineri]